MSTAALAGAASSRLFAQRAGMPVFSNASVGAYTQGLLTRARFERLVGSPFRLFLENRKVANLTLLSVTGYPSAKNSQAANPPVAGRTSRTGAASFAAPRGEQAAAAGVHPTAEQCFQLRFSTGSIAVPQDSYVLDHATLGSFTVFLVPGKDEHGANTCTATFYSMS